MATYRNTRNNSQRTSSAVLGYPWVAVDADTGITVNQSYELAASTADAILADVGDDADLAQTALAMELERDAPRKVLTAKLQRIVDNATS